MELNDLINRLKAIGKPPGNLASDYNPEALANITIGDRLLNENNYPEAISHYDNAIMVQPHNYYSLLQRGRCHLYLKNYERALGDLISSKEINSNTDNNNAIALCYLQIEEYAIAIEHFEVALIKHEEFKEINQNNTSGINYDKIKSTISNNKAVCHFKLKQVSKAIESSTIGIDANPEYPNNYRVRGTVYLSIGKFQEAQCDLQRALELGDSFVETVLNEINNLPNLYQNLMIYTQKGQYSKALELAERMRILMPNDDKTYLTLAAIKMETGDYKGCIEDSKKCLSINPRNEQGWNHLGVAQCSIGEIGSGLNSLRKAIDLGMPGAENNFIYWEKRL